jgi:predicted PurR-regulated permease PerM
MIDDEPGLPRNTSLPDLAWRTLLVAAVSFGAAAGLFLVWRASGSLFIVFAGLLFAVFLDACTRGLGLIWTVSRGWRLAVVCISLLILGILSVSFGGYTVAQQAEQLFATVQQQLSSLRREGRTLAVQGAPSQGQYLQPYQPGSGPKSEQAPDESRNGAGIGAVIRSFLPNAAALLQSATAALGGVAGVLGNLVVIVFLGLYLAVDPSTYRYGVLLLFPPDKRERIGSVLDESAATLLWWVVGQLVSMTIIAALTFAALLLVGMPSALVLALIRGGSTISDGRVGGSSA